MPKTAELKIRIDPALKKEVSELYKTWGLNLSDAITIFFNQSIVKGGLPFSMQIQTDKTQLVANNPHIIPIDEKLGYPLLPNEWDEKEDSIYDKL